MKKYNNLIAAAILAYIATAVFLGVVIYSTSVERSRSYNVEINRIYHSVSGEKDLDTLDLHTYEYVREVSWLALDMLSEEEGSEAFFQGKNESGVIIRPVFNEGQCTGFLRFEYQEAVFDAGRIFWMVEVGIFVFAALVTGILFYLKRNLIRPSIRLSHLAEQLSKGHFKGIVKEEKNQYSGSLLRSIGLLKDSLDVSQKRQMELEKEKKKLLLSLSHDIKTPLNTIRLYAKALERNLYMEEEKKLHAMRQIDVKAEEIEHYVEEIMKNSREGILDIQVAEGEFYLIELMDRVLDTYVEKCGIRMTELLVEPFDNRLLKGDIDRALEVLENIIENAFKYGDGRQIKISFYEEDYCQLIRVFNTGIPVSDNDFNHIYESFFRGINSEGIQGSGLGLYICREIMRKMNGEIFAEKSDDGMAFVLVFC